MPEGIIEFNDWEKIDLRVAEIKSVEEIEGADKLYKLSVDVGSEIGERTLCAGIKEYYSKEELKGKKIIMIVNLAPRKLRGIESQGMVLASVSEEKTPQAYTQEGHENLQAGPEESSKKILTRGKVILISPEKDIEVGSKVS